MNPFDDQDFFRPRLYWSLITLLLGGINFFRHPRFWNLSPFTLKLEGIALLFAILFVILGNLYFKPLQRGLRLLILGTFFAFLSTCFALYHAFQSTFSPYHLYLHFGFFLLSLIATYFHHKDKQKVQQMDRFWDA